MERPDLPSARYWFDKALASAPLIRDSDNHAAIALTYLGLVAEREGYLERAETHFRDAVSHSRLSGNAFILHEALVSAGCAVRDRGNLAEAMRLLQECYQWSREEPSRYVTSDALIAMSLVALGVRDQERAVRLFAAATTSLKSVMGELEWTVAMDRIREATPEPVFTTAWEQGERMSWTEIDTEVASLLGRVLDHTVPVAAMPGSTQLTPREPEVLRLVAEGKSNRVIGTSLSISERTVENHVQHLLAKLNLESRTAAATWAVRNGLV
jgi:DNA-binding CsgD family transcriptional regulator